LSGIDANTPGFGVTIRYFQSSEITDTQYPVMSIAAAPRPAGAAAPRPPAAPPR
jgi:hypothetical protein